MNHTPRIPDLGEGYARILLPEEFSRLRDEKAEELGRIVCTSGGYDPIHPGHATCIVESAKLGDTLVVVVNGDAFLRDKKGKPFQDLATRSVIVACIREVDYVVPFEIEGDSSVIEALKAIRPHVFTKGGDRTDFQNIPEWQTCQELGIEIVPRTGLDKEWSSSHFLRDWGEFCIQRGHAG